PVGERIEACAQMAADPYPSHKFSVSAFHLGWKAIDFVLILQNRIDVGLEILFGAFRKSHFAPLRYLVELSQRVLAALVFFFLYLGNMAKGSCEFAADRRALAGSVAGIAGRRLIFMVCRLENAGLHSIEFHLCSELERLVEVLGC